MDIVDKIKREIARTELLNDMAEGIAEPKSTAMLTAAISEIERLHKALEKIADWQGAWGPYPETSAGWRSFAIVTAREAVPNG